MEAARIPWRPLGRLLVEQGLLTADELELALAEQEKTGRRLGETLVECGFVSGPELSNALAAQYGIELTAETGFGTGLRGVIQQRHETERRHVVRPVLSAVEPLEADIDDGPETEPADLEAQPPGERLLHAQLEEQWALLAAAEERLAESHRELTALAHEYDQRRSQATRLARRARHARERLDARNERGDRFAQLESEARGREAEIDRLRSECMSLRAELAGAEAAAEGRLGESHRELVALAREYDRRRGQATRLGQRARHAREQLGSLHEHEERIEQLERDLGGRETEIDLLRDGIAGAEAAVAERDRLLEGLRREAERRRGQAVRFLERARASTASEEQLRSSLMAVEEQLAESRREHTELAREYDYGRSQAKRLAQRARHVREQLGSQYDRDERIAQLEDDVRGRDTEIERVREERKRGSTASEEQLAATEERLADSRRELASQRERRRSQLARFISRVRERDAHLERLAADVRGCDAEIARLRNENARRRAQTARFLTRLREGSPDPARALPADSHVAFVQLTGRYELVEREGPPPPRNTVLELPELSHDLLVVAGLGRSPLPGDTRACAFVAPAHQGDGSTD